MHSVASHGLVLFFVLVFRIFRYGLGCLDIFLLKEVYQLFRYAVFKVHVRLAFSCLASGDGEIRTLDPLLARQVLSQLSYTPTDAGRPVIYGLSLFYLLFFFSLLFQTAGLKWTRTTDLTLIRRAL